DAGDDGRVGARRSARTVARNRGDPPVALHRNDSANASSLGRALRRSAASRSGRRRGNGARSRSRILLGSIRKRTARTRRNRPPKWVDSGFPFRASESDMRVLFYYRGIENLGVGYLMSMLKQHGHEIDLIFDPGL